MAFRPQAFRAPAFSPLLRNGSAAAVLGFSIALAPFPLPAQAPPAPSPRFVVVIDAAHGGDDSGAAVPQQGLNSGYEKEFTLAFSVRLRSLLAARGIAVVTTRESDASLDPDRRAELANRAQAAACISIHASTAGSGVHLFLSSGQPALPAKILPWSSAQAAYVERSISLAGVLNSALMHAGIKTTLGRTALPGIESMTCPAVAVEVAPEEKNGAAVPLGDSAYQARLAEALAAGLLVWRAPNPEEPRQR